MANTEAANKNSESKLGSTTSKLKKPAPQHRVPKGLIELEPFGVNLLGDGVRPVLLLRDPSGVHNLSVPLNPIEAGVALSQSNKVTKPASPHRGAVAIFKSLDLKITHCVFESVLNQRQMLRIYFKNHPYQKSILLSADEGISLCLFLEVKIYASLDFIQESRNLLASLEGMIEGIKLDPKALKREHAYIQ